ncbi:kielin/chordin-like protein [Ostrea edulis]|uniref:kielin/chordin-like protein n=1 Tax=Ostrea edulis TaxID=37623 RepID=UPI0024AFCEA7|nr:kielin/chordin-like protein [Ostrea edulis]
MLRILLFSVLLTLVTSQIYKKLYTPVKNPRLYLIGGKYLRNIIANRRNTLQKVLPRVTATRDFRFDKVGECPRDVAGKTCVNQLFFKFCSTDYDCSGHQKCCLYGCGQERRCREAVNVPSGCSYDDERYEESSSFPSTDGCNTCRCERGQVTCTRRKCISCYYDGVMYTPWTDFKSVDGCNWCKCLPSGRIQCTKKNCNQQACKYRGERHRVGETFPKGDNCNTCWCSLHGTVSCTDKSCENRRCSLPPEVGLCRASLPRWWYNPEVEKCEMFEYSGCEGNDNKFLTWEDCVRECEARMM